MSTVESSHRQARRPVCHVEEVVVEALVAGGVGGGCPAGCLEKNRSVVSVTPRRGLARDEPALDADRVAASASPTAAMLAGQSSLRFVGHEAVGFVGLLEKILEGLPLQLVEHLLIVSGSSGCRIGVADEVAR